MLERETNFENFYEENRAALRLSGRTAFDILKEALDTTQAINKALPQYEAVQEPVRYAMTVEDLQDELAEIRRLGGVYADYADQGLEGTDDDYEDAIMVLVRTRATYKVISNVLMFGPGPGGRVGKRHKASSAPAGKGCGVTLLAAAAVVVGPLVTLVALV